jgi:probable phosphomutase (TIGR03848 family)
MPTFFLIRHGETDYNKKMHIAGRLPDVHINQKGQEQARALAEKLKSLPIKAIYASPLERTIETAEPLAQALKLEVVPTPGLLETDCGEWQNQSVRKLARLKVWRSLQLYPSLFSFPSGESVFECQHRMVKVIESLRQIHAPQDLVALFSHSDPIKMLVAHYLGMPLDLFQRLSISPASITVLSISEGSGRLLMLNCKTDFSWDALQPPKPRNDIGAKSTGKNVPPA